MTTFNLSKLLSIAMYVFIVLFKALLNQLSAESRLLLRDNKKILK